MQFYSQQDKLYFYTTISIVLPPCIMRVILMCTAVGYLLIHWTTVLCRMHHLVLLSER